MNYSHDDSSEYQSLLQILIPGVSAMCVSVNLAQESGALSKFFPGKTMVFAYGGEVLNPHQPLMGYRVGSGDTIVGLPNATSMASTQWIRASRDTERMHELAASVLTTSTRQEAMRIRDLQQTKCDGYARKRIAAPGPLVFGDFPSRHSDTTIPTPPSMISQDPLPVPW